MNPPMNTGAFSVARKPVFGASGLVGLVVV